MRYFPFKFLSWWVRIPVYLILIGVGEKIIFYLIYLSTGNPAHLTPYYPIPTPYGFWHLTYFGGQLPFVGWGISMLAAVLAMVYGARTIKYWLFTFGLGLLVITSCQPWAGGG